MTPRVATVAVCTMTPTPSVSLFITGGNEGGKYGMRWGPRDEDNSATANRQLPVNSEERPSELERRESISCSAWEEREGEGEIVQRFKSFPGLPFWRCECGGDLCEM